MKPSKNRWLKILLAIVSLIAVLEFWHIKTITFAFINSFMAYEYLDKYKCWYGVFETTKYTLCPAECGKNKGHKEYGFTASGLLAVPGRTVAVDKKVVPLGSILIDIQTGQKYIAEDTGSAVKGYMIDIFVGSGSQANKKLAKDYGKQQKMFIVIE